MNYLFYWALVCSSFFMSLSLHATLLITKVVNKTPDCFILRIYNTIGARTHEIVVPAYAHQNVTITLLQEQQPHAYIIKTSLTAQANSQEIQDFIDRNRSIAYIVQPTGKTARTLYACIPQNPHNLDWWYLGMPLQQSHYAFYCPGKEQDTFGYLPFTPTTTKTLTTSSDGIVLVTNVTCIALSFHEDQAIRVNLDQ